MPFHFLIYLQPTHYFRLLKRNGDTAFPIVTNLPEYVLKRLSVDYKYTSNLARDYDLSWQAIQAGYLGDTKVYTHFESLPAQDNYHFIRKNFHPAWVLYVLLMRLLTCHNPAVEIKGYLASKAIKKQTDVKPIRHPEWSAYRSPKIAQQPLVSVVIPTLNRYSYLKAVLQDFEAQDYAHFEILVVDQSEPFQADFYKQFQQVHIRVIRQEEKALWLARNTAIQKAKGTLIALSEDDVRIKPNWLSSHLKCLDFFKAEVSAGVFYPEGQSIPENRAFFAQATQFATGNAMLYKSVFERVGLFDRQFEKQRMGDGEFGCRVYLAGIRSVSNPVAACIDVKAGTGGLREMGSWDAFRPATFFAPRPIPSVLYYFRTYFGNAAARWALWRTIPTAVLPYQFKKNKKLLLLGLFLSILLIPVILIQVFCSWNLATKKLKQGAMIPYLKP